MSYQGVEILDRHFKKNIMAVKHDQIPVFEY